MGLCSSREDEVRLFHNVTYATGENLSTVNNSIERPFRVTDDACEFNNDNEVVTKMLDTYGFGGSGSQQVGTPVAVGTVGNEGHKAAKAALPTSQTGPRLYSYGSPLGATGHGGRSGAGFSQDALCALPVHQRTTGSKPVNPYGGQVEASGPLRNGNSGHFGGTPDSFSGWNNPSLYRPGFHTATERGGNMRADQGIGGSSSEGSGGNGSSPPRERRLLQPAFFWSKRIRTLHVPFLI